MKHKKLFIAAIAAFTVLVFLATFIVIWFWGDSYPDFSDFKSVAQIPGLNDNAVPQGLANYEGEYTVSNDGVETTYTQDYYFISAYMDNGPSRLYVTGKTTGYIGYVTLKNTDGSDYTGHAGGVATSCKKGENSGALWVVSDGTVYCAKNTSTPGKNIADEVISLASKGNGENVLQFTASFKAYNKASFCYYYDAPNSTSDKLYVGEFYRPGDDNYQTDAAHHITTGNGYAQCALVNEYNTNTSSTNKYGLTLISPSNVETENCVPKVQNIYSIPDLVQGFARIAERTESGSSSSSSGKLVLSASYGLANSSIYYYDWADISASSNRKTYATLTGNNFEYEGVPTKYSTEESPRYYTDDSVNVYFIDGSKLKREYSIPSMAEGLCAKNNNVFVLFESGCHKYKMFVRQILTNIYSFTPRV